LQTLAVKKSRGAGERGRRALTEADGVRGSARTTTTGALRGRWRPGLCEDDGDRGSARTTVTRARSYATSALGLLCDAAVGISSATSAPGLLCDAAAGLLFDAAALGLDAATLVVRMVDLEVRGEEGRGVLAMKHNSRSAWGC
jgi:hypothetical protein